MSEGTVTFEYNGDHITIQCLTNEKLNIICEKFIKKAELDKSKDYYFIYSGQIINEDLKKLNFEEKANEEDKKRCSMNIFVLDEINEKIKEIIEQSEGVPNICIECLKEHKNHKDINYRDLINNFDNNSEYKNNINILINNINNIIKRFQEIKENMIIYYYKSNNIINNIDNINYKILQNINEFNNYNNKILKDINLIINDNDFNNKFKNIINLCEIKNNNKINNEININKINNNSINNNNIIIGQIEIKDEDVNKDIRIINSFEECKKIKKFPDDKYEYLLKNEEEIKKNCIIKIEGTIIPFNYFYNFNKTGKYTIEYSFLSNVTKTSYMFFGCENLININLSNFKSQNVNNMRSMFSNCKSLKNINLSNLNTQKVDDTSWMFDECQSLANIDLSSFNTQNVKNMYGMFKGCKLLTNINLSNFNTRKVENMEYMFKGCRYLTNLNLFNFNTQKVGNLEFMFQGCNIKKENVITNDAKIIRNLDKIVL